MKPGRMPSSTIAAHAGHGVLVGREHHVAGAGAHDRDHAARLDDGRGGDGDVRIDVGDGDGRALVQAGPCRCLSGEAAGPVAGAGDLARHLGVHDIGEARVERLEERPARKSVAPAPDGLVARGRGVARLNPGEPPDEPVAGLDEPVRLRVDGRRLVEDLEGLAEEPLGADLAAVAVEPALPHPARRLVDPVRLGLGRVVLPQLDPRVRLGAQLWEEAERCAVRTRGEHRASGEIDADADDVCRIDARFGKRRGHGDLEDAQVVVGILEGPIGRQRHVPTGERQPLVNHTVAVRGHSRCDDPPIGNVHHHGAARFGTVVHADRVPAHTASLGWLSL